MASPHHTPDGQAGFTIVETMVAATLLLIGLVATLTVLTQASATTVQTRTREQGTSLQRELVEAARSVSYDQLTPTGVGTAVRGRPALGDSSVSGVGWTIPRRNATYTVAMGVCTVDDPRDGIGPHEAGQFCKSGAAPSPDQCASYINATVLGQLPGAGVGAGLNLGSCGIDVDLDGTVDDLVDIAATVCLLGSCGATVDTNPADYKRIVSLVRWPGGYNLQSSQVNNPGLAGAPAVTGLTPATSKVTDTRTSLDLASTTSNTPATVGLYLDGTAIGTASSAGGPAWSASWALGAVTAAGDGAQPGSAEVVDGSYQLSEKAFDKYGQYGAVRSETIEVNRRIAFSPKRVEAGRNGSDIEIEWSPAVDRDSEGFSVERKVGGSGPWVEVCARAVRSACRDTGAPAGTLLTPKSYTYTVVGWDRDPAGALRRGDRSASTVVNDPAPEPPGTPSSLQATLVDGNVQLTWTAPAAAPLKPAPDHYNVYRTTQGAGAPSYADRLDSVYVAAGQPLKYLDTTTTGQLHDYWITAVNAQLGESDQLGKVTR